MLIGVVGKPNTGKSTFFKAATLMDVEIANYPFATIKPNHAISFVRVEAVCREFNTKCDPREGFCTGQTRFVPIDLIDVAGLVPGAYEGKGMGNQFLDDLRQANALIHVVDASGSTNEKGEPVEPGSYDPANDIRFLEKELEEWYLSIFKKVWERFSRTLAQEHKDPEKEIAKQFSGLMLTEDMVKQSMKSLSLREKPINTWTEDELKSLISDFRKKTKPMIIAANKVDTKTGAENLDRLKEKFPDTIIVGCSAESELALKEASKHKLIDYTPGSDDFQATGDLSDKQKAALEFIKANVLKKFGSSGVQDVLDKAVFDLLGYKAIFPGGVSKLADQHGNIIPDCFLMPAGATALDFAYKIHSDIGDNFIKAIDVRKKMPIAKDHVLQHRDMIEIMSSK